MSAETVPIPDISATPAWNALVRHHDEIGGKHLREFFDEDPDRGRELTLTVGDLYIDYSKHRVTRETLNLLVDLAKAADLEARRDAMFAGEHINTSEDRAVLHTALRLPARRRADGRRPGRRRRRARGARRDGRLHRPAAQRRVDRRDGRAHQDRRQHRHRRLGPRPGDGVPGAAALRRRRHLGALRVQRRPRRSGRQARRTRPCHNAFHRRVQDVLDAGDADERHGGAALAHRRARRCRGVQALRRGVDQQEARSTSSASTPTTCSASGTGSAAGTRWTRRSDCRSWPSSARSGSPSSWPASTWSTSTSAPRRWKRMRLCCLASSASGTTSSSARSRGRCCPTPTT